MEEMALNTDKLSNMLSYSKEAEDKRTKTRFMLLIDLCLWEEQTFRLLPLRSARPLWCVSVTCGKV